MTTTATRHDRDVVDRYPSRREPEPSITERLDPVLWGDGDGPLDADQLAAYERDGHLIVADLLGPDVVARCLDAARELASAPSPGSTEVAEPDRDGELRSVFELDRHPEFAELMALPELADVARQLLGSDVSIHQSRLNLKRAFVGRGFPWHSDFETWHVEDGMPAMRAVSCSVALTDNGAHNGPLLLIDGSHRWFVSCVGETPTDHHLHSLRRQEYGVPDPASLSWLADRGATSVFTGRAGSVTFFECNTMHGSADNITPDARTNAFFVYTSVDNALEAPFGADRPRPSHLARREARPVVRR